MNIEKPIQNHFFRFEYHRKLENIEKTYTDYDNSKYIDRRDNEYNKDLQRKTMPSNIIVEWLMKNWKFMQKDNC